MPKHLEDMSKLQRQNQIKRMLSHTCSASALSITEIADRLNDEGFNINRKTVVRDIEDISRAYPLCEGESNPRRFYFDGEFKLDFELVFDQNQLQNIVLALQTLKQMSPGVLKSPQRQKNMIRFYSRTGIKSQLNFHPPVFVVSLR